MDARSKYLSVMIIPDHNASTFQFRVKVSLLKIIAVSLGIFIFLVFLGALSYWKVATVALQAKTIRERNLVLETENLKIYELASLLEKNRDADTQIRKIAGGVIDFTGTGGGYTAARSGIAQNIRERIGTHLMSEDIAPAAISSQPGVAVVTSPFTWPVHGGWITKEFILPNTAKKNGGHSGIDIAAKVGTPVKAAANGFVTLAGWTSDLGNIIIVDHGNGYLSRYGHNSRLLVEKGDIINQGKIIAFVGSSGRSSAPHLHFEICKDGVALNPRDYLLR